MIITVNGKPQEIISGATVAAVVAELRPGPEGRGVAVAVGGEVVPRTEWGATALHEGARVEVVSAVQGG